MPEPTTADGTHAAKCGDGRWALTATGLIGAVGSLLLFSVLSSRDHRLVASEFQAHAEELAEAILGSLEVRVEALQSLKGLYLASREVDRDEFSAFTRPQLERHRSIQALEWIPRLTDSDREEHEAAARAEGFPHYQITERTHGQRLVRAGQRDTYYPVAFMEPFEGNEAALGYDLGSEPTRRAALERARDTARPAATARASLVQADDERGPNRRMRSGLLVFVPVYRHGVPIATLAQRRDGLEGFVLGVFDVDHVVEAALAGFTQSDTDLVLVDVSASPGNRLIYRKLDGDPSRLPDAAFESESVSIEGTHRQSSFTLGGREYALYCIPTPSYLLGRASVGPLAAFCLGIAVTLFLVSYMSTLMSRTETVEKLVTERTEELELSNATVRQRELELAQRNLELERSNEELQQFAYIASHDLQEPLRMVSSYTQLLAKRYEGRLDDDADEFIAFAVGGARRMQRLIDDLLTYSRVRTSGNAFESTDCNQVLDDVLADLKMSIEDARATVTHDPLPTIVGDATQMHQLLQNLIGNALKYRGETSPSIHVSAHEAGRDRPEWTFSVRDNGIGIDPARRDQIFLMFQRLHHRDEFSGTGIGLAICKRIVERHGGRIWLDSEPGRGSEFRFTIQSEEVTSDGA